MTLCNVEEVYHECGDQTKSIHCKVLKQPLYLKHSIGPEFKDQYIKLGPPADKSPPARFYILPQFHKPTPL